MTPSVSPLDGTSGTPFRQRDWVLFWPALVISAAGLAWSFLAYDPGAMTWDSFVMWGMGWRWPWHDWHSPYIALLMGVSRRLVGTPSLLLLLQLLLSWGGLYFAACGLRRRSVTWAALLPLLGLTPMLLVLSGYLHKTPLQASIFLFVFGVLYCHHQWARALTVPWMLLLVSLLAFGIPLREYGLLCAIPLSAFLFHCWRPGTGSAKAGRLLVAAALLSGASLLVHHLVVYQVLEASRLHKMQTLYRYDLAALYARTGVDCAPRMLREEYRSPERMRGLYEQEKGIWTISYAYEGGLPSGYAVPKDTPERLITEEEADYYRDAWLQAVTDHPVLWLQEKAHRFSTALGLGAEVLGFRRAAYFRSRQNVFGLEKRGGLPYRLLNQYMRRVDQTLILRPWLWMVAALCLLALSSWLYWRRLLMRRALSPVLLLLASGSLTYPQLFLTALDNDLRFTYWATVSCVLSLYLFLATALGTPRDNA